MATTAQPHQGHDLFVQIIDPVVARNSIVVFAVSLVLACIGAGMLSKKAFPSAYNRVVRLLLPKSSDAQKASGTHTANLFRVRLLLCAVVMMIGDGINNIIAIHSANTTGTALFVPNQLLRGITFIPAGPIFVYAMSSRVAVVVTMHFKWKTRFLRAIGLTTIGVMLQMQIVLAIGVFQRLHFTPAEWINAQLFPSWTSIAMALLPIISLGGAVWSIRIAFNQPAARTSTASAGASSASSSHGESSDSTSRTSTTVATSSVQGKSNAPLVGHGKSAEAPVVKPASTIQYPLTRAFTILNVIIMIEWLGFIYFNTLQIPPFPVRVAAIQSFLTSLALITEASFEWLLKVHRHRQKALSKRNSTSIRKSRTESKASASGVIGSTAAVLKSEAGHGPIQTSGGIGSSHEHSHHSKQAHE